MSHLGHVEEALELVVLEQYGARWQMTCATASMLAALESQFQAILRHPTESDATAGRAQDPFGRVDAGDEPARMAFFDLAELSTTLGMTHQIAAKLLEDIGRTPRVPLGRPWASGTGRPARPAAAPRPSITSAWRGPASWPGAVRSRRVGDRLGELHQEAEPFADTRPGREPRDQIHDVSDRFHYLVPYREHPFGDEPPVDLPFLFPAGAQHQLADVLVHRGGRPCEARASGRRGHDLSVRGGTDTKPRVRP